MTEIDDNWFERSGIRHHSMLKFTELIRSSQILDPKGARTNLTFHRATTVRHFQTRLNISRSSSITVTEGLIVNTFSNWPRKKINMSAFCTEKDRAARFRCSSILQVHYCREKHLDENTEQYANSNSKI